LMLMLETIKGMFKLIREFDEVDPISETE
jgi:hypothetical protein